MRVLLMLATAIAAICTDVQAADSDLNSYMLRSYRMLLSDKARASRGYDLTSYFTRDLNYGTQKGVIKANHAPLTMCNAAVTETIIEAINLYAADNPSWSPQSAIPAESWNRFDFSTLKSHLFSHDLKAYPPLKGIPAREIPESLRKDIEKFHSESGMAFAIEKFGIGERIEFRNARPGDIVTFDRTSDRRSGKPKYSGHSVVFLGFLDRNQNVIDKYDASKVVGFKYFSSQGGETGGGLSERWAYFKGMCPVRPGNQLPQDPDKAGCLDRVDNATNRARSPLERSGHVTDCCLNKPDNIYGPRVGRLFSPARWTYNTAQPRVAEQYRQLKERIREFVKNRENAATRVALLANGAVRLENQNSQMARRYIDQVGQRFGLDMRAIAKGGTTAPLAPNVANQITRVTPRPIISAANRQVTTAVRDTVLTNVDKATTSAIAVLQSSEAVGVPNLRLDSMDID